MRQLKKGHYLAASVRPQTSYRERAAELATNAEGQGWGWKRIGRFVSGWALILVGIAGCVLPILPGVPLILAGLALLASEYSWAQRWMDKLKAWMIGVRKKL